MVNMLDIQTRKSLDLRLPLLLLLAIVAVSCGLAYLTYQILTLGLIVACFVILFVIAPRGGLLLLLLIRPSVDVFRNIGLQFGPVATLNLNAVLAIVVIILGVFFASVRKHTFLENKISKLFLVYLAFTLVWGMVMARNRMNVSAVFLRELSLFVVFFLSFQLFSRSREVKKLTTICILSSAIPLGVAFLEAVKRGFRFPLHLPSIGGVHPGIRGLFSHPAGLGVYMMLLLMICLGFVLTENRKVGVLKWTAVAGVLYFFLILSYYRTAWAGFLGAVLAVSLLKYRKLLVIILLLTAISLVIAPSILERLPELSSWHWRLGVWNRLLLSKGSAIDYMFGRGLGSVSVLMRDVWRMDNVTGHSIYVKVFFETGILGTCLFLSMKLLLLKTALNLIGKDQPRCVRAVSLAVFGMSIALLIAYATQSIRGPAVLWYYWTFAGALCGMEYQLRKEKLVEASSGDGEEMR